MARRWQVLLVTSVAVFMSFLDVTIVNIAFPDIRASFPESSLSQLSWILNAYSIVFAAALVPAGRLADRFGRRRFFFLGTFVFLGASVACGAAGSVDVLIGARAVQALGGAMLVPASLGLLLPEFPLERRATATALWGATGAVAAATGPSLGGVLVQWTDWRLVFFVNLLIGAAVLVPARRLLRETRDPDRGAVPDALGVVLLAGGVGALALAIVQAPDWGWGSDRAIAAFAVAAAALAGFVWRSATHPHPVVELELFRVRSFAAACLGVGIFSLGFYALLLSGILFLTGVWHYSILKAGFAVTPGPLMAATASAAAGRIADRYGQRVVAAPGGLVFALGCLVLVAGVDATPAYLTAYLPATLLTGTGVGLSFAGFSSAAVAELPPARFATGSAIASCFRQIGAVLGIAVLIAVLGPAPGLPDFNTAWSLMAATGTTAALVALALRRATVPAWTSKSAPSTTPSPAPARSAAPS